MGSLASDDARGQGTRNFDWQPRTRIVFGPGMLARVGELTQALGATRVLLVTDPGLVACGHAPRARKLLEAAGLSVAVFDAVQENPTSRCVAACLQAAGAFDRVDAFVALGGGSTIDTAKGCNFLLTNGGEMRDYWGTGKATRPMLPLVAVPTTAGTGSECQSFALISDPDTHVKMACGDPKAAPKIALLDPELTLSQPARVTALTGIDAITHAVESAVTRKRNPFSNLCAGEAFRLMAPAFPKVLQFPDDLRARSDMQWGAALAGMAIEASMLGAAHSAANPLTAVHGLTHGHAVGLMLPAVVRFNAADPEVRNIYRRLAASAGLVSTTSNAEDAIQALVDFLASLITLAELPGSLTEAGVSESELPRLVEAAAKQWTAQYNPTPVTEEDFLEFYRAALSPGRR